MSVKDEYFSRYGYLESSDYDIDYFLNQPNGRNQMLDAINDIMKTFDFEKVHDTMVALNWCYYDSDEPPTVERLKETLFDLLCSLFEHKCGINSTGGFTAEYIIEKPLEEDTPCDFLHWVDVKAYFAVEEVSTLQY